jgi:hypothetical protein
VTGSNPASEAKHVKRGEEGRAPPVPAEEERTTPVQDGGLPGHLLFDGQEGQVNLLSNPDIPAVQRQRLAARIGRTQGHRHLRRIIEEVAQRGQEHGALGRQPDAGPRDAGLPAGVPEPVQEAEAGFPPPAQIPPELLTSVDLTTFTDDELRHRLDLIQETLRQIQQSSPDTQFLEEQATQISRILAERQVEATVREELEGFLADFSNITVTVRWGEDTGTQSVQHSEEVAVHPPYFMNVMDRGTAHPRTLERYDAAMAHRRAADRATRDLLNEISRREGRGGMGAARAKVGKSHPEDIQRILQTALDRNLIQPGGGRDRPNGEDLRDWLIRYGIGVDCSAFVSQALNQVTEAIRGGPLAAGERLNAGSSGLRGGARGFTRIQDITQLRPGDTMYIPGHIRIITSVRRAPDGAVLFTTAESRAGGQADVGPDRAEWRYHNGRLQMRRSPSEAWTDSGEQPTFGRYQRLQTAMQQAAERATS